MCVASDLLFLDVLIIEALDSGFDALQLLQLVTDLFCKTVQLFLQCNTFVPITVKVGVVFCLQSQKSRLRRTVSLDNNISTRARETSIFAPHPNLSSQINVSCHFGLGSMNVDFEFKFDVASRQ